VDKEELTQLLEGNDILENSRFAALFDFRHALSQGGDDGYVPRMGRLVTVSDVTPNENKEVEVVYLNSTRTDQVEIQGLIPLQRGNVLATAGDTALQRYERRVKEIKTLTAKMNEYTPRMLDQLDELASRGSAPILKLSS
ncbi:MAG: hypothetical protein ACNA8W_23460, partial [Bradymonadaceae bacterium]